ncbi:MAG: hypothetical protein GF398_16935 [Chitinivibrionales bacterium]|nr:hypothetical protein [Chitinivibrionales bacterium]
MRWYNHPDFVGAKQFFSLALCTIATLGAIAAHLRNSSPQPWNSIGGCGAESSSPSSNALSPPVWPDDITSQKRLHVQTTYGFTSDQKIISSSFVPRLYGFARKHIVLGISMPLLFNRGEKQQAALFRTSYLSTGGVGDLSIDGGYILYVQKPILLRLALKFPTGVYDAARGPEADRRYVPANMQPGSGIYTLTLSVRHQRAMLNKGEWNLFAAYSFPFHMRLASGKNEFLDERLQYYSQETSDKRFYYHFKPYGENDIGRYVPPTLHISWHYAHIVNHFFRHTWATLVSFPLGVAWIPDERIDRYAPYPAHDHRMWRSTWRYVPELRIKGISLMWFVALPLHDKTNASNSEDKYDESPHTRLDGPDWSGILRQWSLGTGIRYAFWSWKHN